MNSINTLTIGGFVRITSLVSALVVMTFLSVPATAKNPKNTTWPGFEAFSFDRPQYYYNIDGHDYTQEEIDTMVMDFHEAGFAGIMLEFEWEHHGYFSGLGRGWYAPTNGDPILSQYFKDEKIAEYFISSAKSYGLKISVIVSSLNDMIGTNEDGYTDPFSPTYPTWIYPNDKALDLFKRKVDVIATLDVDQICIDFARTPYKATTYNDTVNAVLELTDSEIEYISTNYPELAVSVAINPTYRAGLSQDPQRIKMHGGKVLHWENYDDKYTLGVESNDEGYFIYPCKPSFWWDVGRWTSLELAEVLVSGTDASPAIVFLHTPLSHDDYLDYSIQGVIEPGCYAPGDVNADSTVDITDVAYLINYLFQSGPAPVVINSADANGSCDIDITDVLYLINYLFQDGPAPVYGCVGFGFLAKAIELLKKAKIDVTYQDGTTTILLDSPIELLSLQLELSCASQIEPVNLIGDELELVYGHKDEVLRIGLFDPEGSETIPAGKHQLIRLKGKCKLTQALVCDNIHNSWRILINTLKETNVR